MSKLWISPVGCDQDFEAPGWKKVSLFPILGHLIADNGASTPCIDFVLSAAWKAFWSFVRRAGTKALSTALRLRQINIYVVPIIFFRAPRWAFTISIAHRLAKVQRKMLRTTLPIRVLPGEVPEQFARRSGRIVRHVQNIVGPWGALWAFRISSWGAHILRDTMGMCWSARVLDVRSSSELVSRRSLHANRAQTRKFSGWSCRRWTDGVPFAMKYLEKCMLERHSFRGYSGAEFSMPVIKCLIPCNAHLE